MQSDTGELGASKPWRQLPFTRKLAGNTSNHACRNAGVEGPSPSTRANGISTSSSAPHRQFKAAQKQRPSRSDNSHQRTAPRDRLPPGFARPINAIRPWELFAHAHVRARLCPRNRRHHDPSVHGAYLLDTPARLMDIPVTDPAGPPAHSPR